MKHQSSVGGRIDARCGSPANNVRAAYKQWMVTKGVRDLDPDFRPASAGMHDEAQALVPEALETPWHEWLWLSPTFRSTVCRGQALPARD